MTVQLCLWIFSFTKPYRRHLALFIFVGLLLTAGEMMIPKVIGIFIDIVLPNRNF
jgi:ABC-type multidrug transport system fused ATPase/permease subunit